MSHNLTGYHCQSDNDEGGGLLIGGPPTLILPDRYTIAKAVDASEIIDEVANGSKWYARCLDNNNNPFYVGPCNISYGLAQMELDSDWRNNITSYLDNNGNIITASPGRDVGPPYCYLAYCYASGSDNVVGDLPGDGRDLNYYNYTLYRYPINLWLEVAPLIYKYLEIGGAEIYKLNGKYGAIDSGPVTTVNPATELVHYPYRNAKRLITSAYGQNCWEYLAQQDPALPSLSTTPFDFANERISAVFDLAKNGVVSPSLSTMRYNTVLPSDQVTCCQIMMRNGLYYRSGMLSMPQPVIPINYNYQYNGSEIDRTKWQGCFFCVLTCSTSPLEVVK